jgi:hypothetical protein
MTGDKNSKSGLVVSTPINMKKETHVAYVVATNSAQTGLRPESRVNYDRERYWESKFKYWLRYK